MPELKIKPDNSGFWLWNKDVDELNDDDLAVQLMINSRDKVMVIWFSPEDASIVSAKMTGLAPEECAEYTKNGVEEILNILLQHSRIQEAQEAILQKYKGK